jgi:hypothetical protein
MIHLLGPWLEWEELVLEEPLLAVPQVVSQSHSLDRFK